MILEVRFLNDDGTVAAGPFSGPATQPLQWKTQYERPLVDDNYKIFGVTATPMVVLDRSLNRSRQGQ